MLFKNAFFRFPVEVIAPVQLILIASRAFKEFADASSTPIQATLHRFQFAVSEVIIYRVYHEFT